MTTQEIDFEKIKQWWDDLDQEWQKVFLINYIFKTRLSESKIIGLAASRENYD
jgi:hypothetical protein